MFRGLFLCPVVGPLFSCWPSVLLLAYTISSGALGSSDLLLSHPIISLACHITIILICPLNIDCIYITITAGTWLMYSMGHTICCSTKHI